MIIACLIGSAGVRSEDALYGQQPGRNASFIRFVNALDEEVQITSEQLPSIKLGISNAERVGSYMVLDKEHLSSIDVRAKTSGAEVAGKFSVEPGGRLSIVLRSEGREIRAVALSARSEVSQSRTILSFINAAPNCGSTSLTLISPNTTIFANVPVDGERSRRIKPISAQVSANCGSLGAATTTLKRSEAGTAYSVWLLSLRGGPALILGADTLPSWTP